jgi:hypothetical protein
LVRIVGHKQELGGSRLLARRQREAQVEWFCFRTEKVWQHGRCRLHLGVAIVRGLDDPRVHPHRRIVDEDAPVHLGKIYVGVDTVLVRVQRAWDVGAVKT